MSGAFRTDSGGRIDRDQPLFAAHLFDQDVAEQRAALDTDAFDTGLLATGKVDGRQYAIPQARGTETVVYDAKQWKAAGVAPPREGWTWNDWADTMRELARRTGEPGGTDPGWSEDAFEVWLRGRGKALYTEDRRLGFTADDLTRYWTFTDRLEDLVTLAEQALTCVRGAMEQLGARKRDVAGLGITGQQHGVVLVDELLTPLTPLINWQDRRAEETVAATGQTYVQRAVELAGQ